MTIIALDPYSTDYVVVVRGIAEATTEDEEKPAVIDPNAGEEFANAPKSANKIWVFVVTTFCALLCITILLLTGDSVKKDK